MNIQRNIEKKLTEWKNLSDRKPLMLRGARQVGKTFTVNEFARNFEIFISLNLERPRERELFTNINSGRELFDRILLYKGIKADAGRSLLFIDEIQNSPDAIKSLRYFYEEVQGLSVIAAGSLLEVFAGKEGFSFPVGRVTNLNMYPVNFAEYLQAVNAPLLEKASGFSIRDTIPDDMHRLLLEHFNTYSFIGGMPQAAAKYIQTGSYAAVRDIYDSLLRGYIEDVEKYSSLAKAKYLSHAVDRAPLYAGERVTFEKFGESLYRSREMKEAFDMLEKALLVYFARPSFSQQLPVIADFKKSPKLFFLDTGLANFRIGFKDFFSSSADLSDVYRGKIAEQIAAQELVAQTWQPPCLHFWIRGRGEAETDFLYQYRDFVLPVEVKSGKLGKLKSLQMFMETSPHPYAVRVYSGAMQVDKVQTASGKPFYLFSMPFYLLWRFEEMLEQFVESYKQ